VDVLRGLVYERVPDGTRRVMSTATEWYQLLADVFGLTLRDVAPDERDLLWRRVIAAHEARQTAG
jgi:N-hydroxyarylamine O-acetyltransferase